MVQNIIVFIIVAIAAGLTIQAAVKKYKATRAAKNACDGCTGCELKKRMPTTLPKV